MDDLAAALLRLAAAFPDDPGPAADPFTLNDEFDLFVWHSPWTFGDAEDFVGQMLTWTPRVLRLLTGGQLGYCRQVCARFMEAGWRDWPPHQRVAVEDVLRAWWRATLNEYPGAHPVADVLTVVILMMGEVEPWLTAWSTVGGAAAAHQLRDLMHGRISWAHYESDVDAMFARYEISCWMRRDGLDILCALPPGSALDTALTGLAKVETLGWY